MNNLKFHIKRCNTCKYYIAVGRAFTECKHPEGGRSLSRSRGYADFARYCSEWIKMDKTPQEEGLANIGCLRALESFGRESFPEVAKQALLNGEPTTTISAATNKDTELARLKGLLAEAEHFAIFILLECDEWGLAYDAAKSLIKKIGESHDLRV
jgi:hypothetical protein